MEGGKYQHLTRDELLRLLVARDRRDATRFGLVWEANEIERDKAINADFVALDLDPDLSTPQPESGWNNLIIEGDNFDALRYLRMTHAGKVKCIYIDPPYNTGNKDFVYNDRFVDKNDAWRHSTWCEFMYQRLLTAKDLLTQDGVIFVSIDDHEFAALRLLMGKVFSDINFVASFIWRKVDSPNDNKVSITPDHEYIVCFSLSGASVQVSPMAAPHIIDAYGSKTPDGRRYRDRLLKKNGKNSLRKDRPTMFFGMIAPDRSEVFPIHDNGEEACWAMGRDSIKRHETEKTLIWKKRTKQGQDVWEPYTREFAPEVPTRPYPTIWADLPTMRQAKAMLREIFDSSDLFSTPKPIELLDRIIRMSSGPEDIILDFFAGSGTTAHAVLKLNAEDGGRRRFILVSSTEATASEPDKNLCRDVCAKRVRRVIEGYGNAPALGGDFAYLRCKRIPAGQLLEIDHEQVWTALQMIHLEALTAPERSACTPARLEKNIGAAATSKEADKSVRVPFLCAGDEMARLIYVPRFSKTLLPALRESVKDCAAAVIYSWQPETLRLHIRAGNVQHEAIPESLARRFGLNA
jgi:adenine-specific DNA-methyltransferase